MTHQLPPLDRLALRPVIDATVLDGFLGELLSLVEARKLSAELCERFIDAFEAFPESFVVFDANRISTPFADHLVISLEPTDGLLRFMSAARTSDGDLSVVEDTLSHLLPSHAEIAGGIMSSPFEGVES